jgi:AAHS family 4-hydroxybenzoate transporter-like MFS transporter
MADERTLDVRQFIDEHRFTGWQWLILILGIMVLMLDGFDVAAIGFIAPALVTQWGIPRPALGPVLAAALWGLAIGALVGGPVADRYGRKKVLVGAVFAFGLMTLASAYATTLTQLTWLRFLTGLGLGAAFPNTVTLVAEYCPEKRRSFLIGLLLTGFVLGTALGGIVAAAVIARFGWPAVLKLGGIIPLVLSFVMAWQLPESVRFLVARNAPTARIAAILSRVSSDAMTGVTRFVLPARDASGHTPLRAIFANRLGVGTVLLWLIYFSGLVVVYFTLSWMPTLATAQGYTLETAATITFLFTLSGPPGALLAGWLMDRMSPHLIIGVCYAAGAAFVWLLGTFASQLTALYLSVAVAGFFINAAQSSMSALAAGFYPTIGRATGVAWMMGVGRFGGILGAMIGGTLLGMNLSFAQLFAIVAAWAVVAAIAVLAKGAYYAWPSSRIAKAE